MRAHNYTKSVVKRLGFILDARHPDQTALIDACRDRFTAGYVKLDPKLPADRLVTAWRLWIPAQAPRTSMTAKY